MPIENIYETKNNDKVLYRTHLADFAVEIRESDPQSWWEITASHLRKINKLAVEVQTPELRTHIKNRIGIAIQALRKTVDFSQINSDPNDIAKIANDAIMSASMRMAEPFCTKEVEIGYERYSLD